MHNCRKYRRTNLQDQVVSRTGIVMALSTSSRFNVCHVQLELIAPVMWTSADARSWRRANAQIIHWSEMESDVSQTSVVNVSWETQSSYSFRPWTSLEACWVHSHAVPSRRVCWGHHDTAIYKYHTWPDTRQDISLSILAKRQDISLSILAKRLTGSTTQLCWPNSSRSACSLQMTFIACWTF